MIYLTTSVHSRTGTNDITNKIDTITNYQTIVKLKRSHLTQNLFTKMDPGSKRKSSYDFNFKSEVIEFAEENGNNPAAHRYKITPKMVREWRKRKEEIVDVVSEKRTIIRDYLAVADQ